MSGESYLTKSSDTLNTLLQTKYSVFSNVDKKNIALTILFANPNLAIDLLPSLFWVNPNELKLSEVGEVLNKKISEPMLIYLPPCNPSFISPFNVANYNNYYNLSGVINNSFDEKKSHIISVKTLEKASKTITTDMQKTSLKAILLDPEVTKVGAIAFFSNMEIAFPKILKYLGAKFELKMVEGEKFFFVYGSKKIEGELDILLNGVPENDVRIVAIGMGSVAAQQIAARGTSVTIVVVAAWDIVKHIFSKKETTADLLANIAIDMPPAIMANAVWALGAYVLGGVAAGFSLPILLIGGGIALVCVFAVAPFTNNFLKGVGFNNKNVNNFIIQHHIDIFVNRATYSWEQYNYEKFNSRSGVKF